MLTKEANPLIIVFADCGMLLLAMGIGRFIHAGGAGDD